MTAPAATVLIPAWNESSVIGRTLSELTRGPDAEKLQIVVIANACTDETVAVARTTAPEAAIVETAVPGKCNALNLGLAHAAPELPVVVLDADLQVSAADILALVAPLRTGDVQATCGRMEFSTAGASAMVRAWARAWARNPYFARGKFGGLFALSPKGVARVFPLPPITADDEYVRRSFTVEEIAFVSECRFVAQAPRTLAALIRTRRRSLRGTRALIHARPKGEGARPMLRSALAHPADWPDFAVFLGVSAWVRLLLAAEPRSPAHLWERDTTTRQSSVQP